MAIIDNNYHLRTLITLSILLNICLTTFSGNPLSESEILLKFKDTIANNSALSSWNASKKPCPTGNWVGVYCFDDRVWGLRLERMGLKGTLNMEALKDLKGLRTISIMGNEFEGEFPNVRFVSALKAVFLSDNKFYGEIKADAFNGMISLKKVHAARNQFSGPIPMSLTVLPRLLVLMLEQNKFTGELPSFQQERLYWFNVSNNQLDGPVPQSLAKFDASSFWGNKHLCGGPLPHCNPLAKLPIGTIILSLLVAVTALAAVVAAFMILRHRKQTPEADDPNLDGPKLQGHKRMGSTDLDKMDLGPSPVIHHASAHGKTNSSQNNSLKLTFLRDDRERFDLADLLRSSAEILGSGVFGSTYKAVIGTNGPVMVVKRYRQMNNVGREEFQEHMRRLGKLRHQNLLPLVAFYYRKEEKLLVSDYIGNVSLAVHLHGNRGGGLPSLDWPKRLKIVKGVARGLLYLYNELPGLIAPHGHLKSTNVLLNDSWESLLTDYALSPIVNQEHAQDLMIAYKSPEYRQLGRITKKTDVWSLGILILEILTGRFPTNTIQQGKGSDTDLATWVQSIVREDWMEQVFDKDMGGKSECEEEMMKLLKIGLGCCEMDVEKRWDMKEVVERIEEVRERDHGPTGGNNNNNHNKSNASKDDDFYSSEGHMHSSSDDFTNSSTWNGTNASIIPHQ